MLIAAASAPKLLSNKLYTRTIQYFNTLIVSTLSKINTFSYDKIDIFSSPLPFYSFAVWAIDNMYKETLLIVRSSNLLTPIASINNHRQNYIDTNQ